MIKIENSALAEKLVVNFQTPLSLVSIYLVNTGSVEHLRVSGGVIIQQKKLGQVKRILLSIVVSVETQRVELTDLDGLCSLKHYNWKRMMTKWQFQQTLEKQSLELIVSLSLFPGWDPSLWRIDWRLPSLGEIQVSLIGNLCYNTPSMFRTGDSPINDLSVAHQWTEKIIYD